MRWLVRIAGAVAVFVLILAGLVALIPSEKVARLAAEQFQRLTGRELQITGDVSPKFWPVLGVSTGPVTISNADWSQSGAPMLAADTLVIEINAAALLGGEVKIQGLRAERPRILLERSASGQENWVFGGGGGGGEISAATPGVGRAWTLELGEIRDGSLRFIDHGAGRDISVERLDAALRIPDFTGDFSIEASAYHAGQPLSLSAEAGQFSAFSEGRIVPLTLGAKLGNATLDFAGRAGWQPLSAEGRLTADLSDLSAFAALTGAAPPDLPEGFGAQKLTVEGDAVYDTGALYLRSARIIADENVIAGDLDLRQGEARPKLSGNLRAERLSLTGLTGAPGNAPAPEAGAAAGETASAGWSQASIDVSALGLSDAELSLAAKEITIGRVSLGETRLYLNLERARAVFDIRQLAAYGGAVQGEFVINGRGGLSLGGNLTLAGLELQPLLADMAGQDRLISRANLDLRFLAVGNSIAALMQSLSGEGNLTLGKGEIRGLDIPGMLRTLDTTYVGEGQKTVFDGVSGSFTLKDGNLSNQDLQLIAPYLQAAGAGRIGIGARDFDYRIRPTAFPGADGSGGVMVPLRITGPWAKPTYRLDLEAMAREKMEAEAKAAEERIKAELEERLRRELGAEPGLPGADGLPGAGESLEDAAKRRARDALGQEAGKLLEGLIGGN